MKRKIGVFTLSEVLAMGIPLALVLLLWVTRVPLFAALYVAGRANGCSFTRALEVEKEIDGLNRVTMSIDRDSRIDQKEGDLIHWQTPHGAFWTPANTSMPFLLSEQLSGFYGTGERRVRKGDIVLDCGANVGAHVWEALRAGAAKVVAIEPSDRNIECLRRNFEKEIAAGRVIVYPKGVWHQSETLTFHTFENSTLDSLVLTAREEETKAPKSVSIQVTTIDQIVAELGLEKVDFIKMDVEGAERNALEGAKTTISRFHPRMSIATENLPDDPEMIPRLVNKLGNYRQECGPCRRSSSWALQAEAFYFY